MITIIAEKFDNAGLIISALAGININGKTIYADDYDKYKGEISKQIKGRGFVEIEYEGQGYYVTWAQGHLLTLKQAKDYNDDYKSWTNIPLPFIPSEYEIMVIEGYDYKTSKPTGKPSAFASRQLSIIDDLLSKSSSVINALDDDREGDLIYKTIVDHLGYSHMPFEKILLGEMTTKGIKRAISTLRPQRDYELLGLAGYGRMIADWVIGINMSTLATLHYAEGVMVPLGRVQTPVLKMIVDRENEINNFVSEPFWNIEAEFLTGDTETFKAKHTNGRYIKKEDALGVIEELKGNNGVVSGYDTKPSKRQVPYLFNLAELQKYASSKFKMTASETLEIAQELYMSGLLTYPRTDSRFLTDDMMGVIDDVLDNLSGFGDFKEYVLPKEKRHYDKKRHFDSSKVSSHYAIIPTVKKATGLSGNKKNIYDAVSKSVIKMVYEAATVDSTKVSVLVGEHEFKASGSVMRDPQWMVIEDMPKNKTLPILELDQMLTGLYEMKEGSTEPPKRYTDGTLIVAMEDVGKTMEDKELKEAFELIEDGGLGRPATRAGIIENVVKRFCTSVKGVITPNDTSMKLIAGIPLEELKSPEMTAEWELKLDEIAKDELDIDTFISGIEKLTQEWTEIMMKNKPSTPILSKVSKNQTDMVCPSCGSSINKVKGGYICTGFDSDNPKACKFIILNKLWGGVATISDAQCKKLIKDSRSGLIKNIKKKSGDGTYDAYLIVKENGLVGLDFGTGFTVTCPKCGGVAKDGGFAINCENNRYQDDTSTCDFAVMRTIAKKRLTDNQIKKLVETGTTGKLSGFKSKLGKDFETTLILDKDSKVKFKF